MPIAVWIILALIVAAFSFMLWFIFYGADAIDDGERDARYLHSDPQYDIHFGLSKIAYDFAYARTKHRQELLAQRKAQRLAQREAERLNELEAS